MRALRRRRWLYGSILPQVRFTGFLGLFIGMIAGSLAPFSPAQADPVAFNFNGTVTVSNLPQVEVGDPFNGFIRFDEDIPFPSSEGTLRVSPAGQNMISVDFMNELFFTMIRHLILTFN